MAAGGFRRADVEQINAEVSKLLETLTAKAPARGGAIAPQ